MCKSSTFLLLPLVTPNFFVTDAEYFVLKLTLLFVLLYFLFENKFNAEFFTLTSNDWILLLILASVCTAYAFTASVKVMQQLSPYTIMLTTSLEPVYGIILAYFLLGGKEKMSFGFYMGALLIVVTVILNGIVKHYFEDKE